MGALYVQRYFDNNVRSRVIEMVDDIQAAFIKMLHDVEWMDNETKQKAIRKAQALIAHIGYPNELINATKIDELYKELELASDEYFMNALRLNRFQVDFSFRQLYVPLNKTDWISHAAPAVSNAFYSAQENSIRE